MRGDLNLPLLKFYMYEGRNEEEIKTILDSAHEVMVESFQVPERDRYQLVHQLKPYEMIAEDTGLGFERSSRFILVHMFTRKRPEEQLTAFYQSLTGTLEKVCGISPQDVMISVSVNGDSDWSFGEGKAQFLTKEL
jgi:hypothetical protein